MKRILFLLPALALSALPALAQDKIITKEGDVITAFGTDVGGSSIFYREQADENAPTLKIAKEKVLMVKYENGKKVMMSGEETSAAPTTPATSPAAPQEEEAEDVSIPAEENEALKVKYTPRITYIKEPKDKKADGAVCELAVTKKSVLADRNLEISYEIGYYFPGDKVHPDPYWTTPIVNWGQAITLVSCQSYKLSVTNKTDKTIYLDLSNSYILRGKKSQSFYIPTAKGSTEASVVYSQRIVSVAPMSTIDLSPVRIFTTETANAYNFGGQELKFTNIKKVALYYSSTFYTPLLKAVTLLPDYAVIFPSEGQQLLHRGEMRTFDEATSPVTFGALLAYSFSETSEKKHTLKSQLYVEKMIGLSSKYPFGLKNTGLSDSVTGAYFFGVKFYEY